MLIQNGLWWANYNRMYVLFLDLEDSPTIKIKINTLKKIYIALTMIEYDEIKVVVLQPIFKQKWEL